MTGLFISLDGPGGAGKSTLVAELADQLRALGRTVHTTAEPSASPLGMFTRSHADQIDGRALACLVAADRYQHLTDEIRPRLAEGDVLCDRYLGSSLVLQQIDGVPGDFILDLNQDIDLPDAAVILTADPDTILARIAARGAHHRFERSPDMAARELDLYGKAAVILANLNVPVIPVNVTTVTPEGAARRIVGALVDLMGSLAPNPA